MNHEYVLFSKNTCQNSMVNVLDKDKILWYVMRAYKNENTAEDRLSNEIKMRIFNHMPTR